MKQLQPIIWSKGTVLQPQHLQLQDRFLESVLHFRQQSLTFAPYGFTRLRLDHEALAVGQLQILDAAGLLPDGLAFDMPSADRAPGAKLLAPWFETVSGVTPESVDLHLAIPAYRNGGLNISRPEAHMDARYCAEFQLVRDENNGQVEKPVQTARKSFRILTGDEVKEGLTTMRVGRVRRNETGQFQLDPAFVPPLLDISASDRMLGLLRRLVEIISAKSTNLAGMRRHKNLSLADFTSADIASFWLLYTINTALPLLRHVLESRRGHPEELFSQMLSLAGALTTFSLDIQPRDFPVYDHDNLGACVAKLDKQLHQLLEATVPNKFASIALKLERPFIYAAALDDEKYLENTRMFLAVSSNINEGELIQRLPVLAKLCSATHIDHLVNRGLPGVPLIHLSSPPTAIPVKLNYRYFSLSQTGGAWESILRARNIAVYLPVEIPNPQVELVILFP